jgi:enoyl-CoA hydratase
MNHEGHAQLYVRMTTENFEEAVRARKEKRKPVFRDELPGNRFGGGEEK